MLVSILGRNLKVTEAMEYNFENKLSRLDKYFAEEVEAKVTVSHQKNQMKVEVTIPFRTGIIRAEAMDMDLYNGLDAVITKLNKQLSKQKQRMERKHKDTIRHEEIEAYVPGVDELQEEEKIVKRKSFEYKPMSEEDAILQMELLGHDFFVFDNYETEKIAVLYKRKDGHYGMIEPK